MELARLTFGFSGAQIELVCRDAGMACVKEAVRNHILLEVVKDGQRRFSTVIERIIREDIGHFPDAVN